MKNTNNQYYIVIRGPLGIGKSTIAKKLAKRLNAKYVSYDRILDEHSLDKIDKEIGYIPSDNFKEANKIIVPKIKKSLENGNIVVFDGNFYWKSQIEDLLDRLDCPYKVFTLEASLETCIERDKNREKSHGEDAARAVYKKSTGFNYGVNINTENKSSEEVVREILDMLK